MGRTAKPPRRHNTPLRPLRAVAEPGALPAAYCSVQIERHRPMINDLWYKNAVIYCLSVGTFMDANGDGVGDFQGLMRRLDYLHGLGVTAIWLMPFQPSPGTRRRLRHLRLLRRRSALRHARRLRRVHPRLQAARHPRASSISSSTTPPTSIPGSKPRAARSGFALPRLVCLGRQEGRPTPTRAWCFPACRNRPGRTTRKPSAWYFHRFYDFQPDLNTVEPAGAGRDPEDHGLLDPARRLRLPHGRGAVRHRHQGRRR